VRPLVEEYGFRFIGNATIVTPIEFSARAVLAASPEALAAELRGALPRPSREDCVARIREVESRIRAGELSELHPYGPPGSVPLLSFAQLQPALFDLGGGPQRRSWALTDLPGSIVVLADGEDYGLRIAR